jgi:hypothetical protein
MEQSTKDVVATKQPSESQIPDLVKIGSIPTSTVMDVETSVLEPVQHSQTSCRFVLENKGILHSHSKIVVAMQDPVVADQKLYWPINVGCMALISRARLQSGGKTLIEQTDFNHLTAYESMFLSNEHNKQKEVFQNGRLMAHNFNYDTSDMSCDGVIIDTGKDFNDLTNTYELPSQIEIKAGSEFQISLSDLFPFLKQQQLPLFMINEQITITLEFSGLKERMWQTGGAAADVNIDTSKTRLIADYQFYPGEMMEAFKRQNANLTLTYMVYRLSKTSIDAGTQKHIRNIGGNGRIVTQIVSGLEDPALTFVGNPLGKYQGVAPGNVSATQSGQIDLNVKYNNHLLYPEDVSNFAQHQHNTAQAKGMVPFVTRFEYSGEGGADSVSAKTLEGIDLTTFLDGTFCWQAHRLNRNERVNSRGIEYQVSYNLNSDVRTQRVWLEMVRLASLNPEGKFMIQDA